MFQKDMVFIMVELKSCCLIEKSATRIRVSLFRIKTRNFYLKHWFAHNVSKIHVFFYSRRTKAVLLLGKSMTIVSFSLLRFKTKDFTSSISISLIRPQCFKNPCLSQWLGYNQLLELIRFKRLLTLREL